MSIVVVLEKAGTTVYQEDINSFFFYAYEHGIQKS